MEEANSLYTVRAAVYGALVLAFVLIIVLQAWFVRRLTTMKNRLANARAEQRRLRATTAELADRAGDMQRGLSSNAAAIKGAEEEMAQLSNAARAFLAQHPELMQEFGELVESAPAAHQAAGVKMENDDAGR